MESLNSIPEIKNTLITAESNIGDSFSLPKARIDKSSPKVPECFVAPDCAQVVTDAYDLNVCVYPEPSEKSPLIFFACSITNKAQNKMQAIYNSKQRCTLVSCQLWSPVNTISTYSEFLLRHQSRVF
ncbi:hypothetical protein K501DRAFT_278389 [Backusella circina FSU 941]|nr:hypothetical protein K501DRAFT_278389 [Backusella circina FSU 941]